jgi:hypothetical protein
MNTVDALTDIVTGVVGPRRLPATLRRYCCGHRACTLPCANENVSASLSPISSRERSATYSTSSPARRTTANSTHHLTDQQCPSSWLVCTREQRTDASVYYVLEQRLRRPFCESLLSGRGAFAHGAQRADELRAGSSIQSATMGAYRCRWVSRGGTSIVYGLRAWPSTAARHVCTEDART